ncbi:hypothetical protein SO802_018777 [Lithocarpus litseifolius]|uniref:Uncharacterized protein n=1 Tax=Lithocarpus litseifolius TaxID=425828 RepID=A0AAW2CLX8_9ROSI
MALYHLDRKALIWFQNVEQALQRFGVTAYDDPMEALTHLKQTSSVVAYKGCDMEIEQKSGVQLVELEDDGVMLGHQKAV